MKNAFKNWKVWLVAGILSILGLAIPFIILIITLNLPNTAAFAYPYMLCAFAAIYLLIGFIWGDLHAANYRRKEKNWDGKLPDEVKTSTWSRHLPFYIAAIIVFSVFMVFEIIYWVSGGYPWLN